MSITLFTSYAYLPRLSEGGNNCKTEEMPSPYSFFSAQTCIHNDLENVVVKHLNSIYRKPISPAHLSEINSALDFIVAKHAPIILDSGCGTGQSTLALANLHPESIVVGIDRSHVRLDKARRHNAHQNIVFVAANLEDFWRLFHDRGLVTEQHYLLYPNPWPRARDLRHRFHGHPIFSTLLAISKQIELRTNWQIYAEEFAKAASFVGQYDAAIEMLPIPAAPTSAFEQKYADTHTPVWRCIIKRRAN